ncbi:MAG: helix-turn-helix transcriptional regulator [Candidatus Bathyarchaeota archaeon]|nr:helix-turn-helix transcriptional regulator [Candidatus Bathyarchaeota archaeon]
MAIDKILDRLAYGEPRPNKFTIYMGEQIKKARLEAKISQEELAERIYVRRATISAIENGKGEVEANTLVLLAHILEKPFDYFFPPYLYKEIKQDSLTPLEIELLIHFRKIWDDTLRKVVIDQVRVIGEFDPKELVTNSVDEIAAMVEEEKTLLAIMQKHRKKGNK